MNSSPFLLLIAVFLFSACSKNNDAENISLDVVYTNTIEPCFSEIKLRNSEIIITTTEQYEAFEDSIRRYFSPSCSNEQLPEVNFDTHFFVGKYVAASGCSVDIERLIVFNPNKDQYEYTMHYKSEGTCELFIANMNWATIPIYKEDAPLVFNVSIE